MEATSPSTIEVTDATFETAVLDRSTSVPVVVDLWAAWCGPCKTLGPILERVIAEKKGEVLLAKVDVDANPRVAATFSVQSIPAVFALRNRKVLDSFVGALPEAAVREWVDRLVPAESEADSLIAAGDESSLREAVSLEPGNVAAVTSLAEILVEKSDDGRKEALELLAKVPETPAVRRLAARARVGDMAAGNDEIEARLDSLLPRVKADDSARIEFLDLLEVMGADNPLTGRYRKALTARLF